MIIAADVELPDAEVAEICRRYQVKELAVFGSAARGEMRPDSDLDLLVEFLPEAEVSLLQHFAAERLQLLQQNVQSIMRLRAEQTKA